MHAISRLANIMNERQQLLAGSPYASTALLSQVRAPRPWGVFASVGPNFRHAIFGRDSIEVAEDVYLYDQELAHDIIITLARLQGTKNDQQTEEEPGKVHHEYRTTHFADQPVPEQSIGIMRKLQTMWGDPQDGTMLYYGTYDATPLYIRLVQKYCAVYGDSILHSTYTDKEGVERTIRHSLHIATKWLVDKLLQRQDHLLAYRRSNPRGIENQVWKDSRTAYIFSDGTLPDHDRQIVSTELQGYVYDALLYAAQIFADKANTYTQLAGQVQQATLQKLWMPHAQFFAQGLGTDQTGQERQIDTLASNGALLLDSALLQDVSSQTNAKYVSGIEKTIMSPDFLTPAGLRCRALRHAKLLAYTDYHGSYAVWPKETLDIARGLLSFGRTASAVTLYKSIMHSFRIAKEFYELFYVDANNKVYYDQAQALAHFSSTTTGQPLPVPEPGQAWSISAAIASSHALAGALAKKFPRQHSIQQALALPNPLRPATLTPTFNQLLVSAQAVLQRRSRQHK